MSRLNQHTSNYDRHGKDFYRSPERAIDPLIKHFPELRDGTVYEPAAGDGRLTRGLIHHGCNVIATDLHAWPNAHPIIEPGIDFLQVTSLPDDVQWIVANPPYKDMAAQFVDHALDLGVQKVHMLLKAVFLSAKSRGHLVERCVSQMQLSRLSMLPPGVKDLGKTPTTDYCWFTFQQQPLADPWMKLELIDDKAPLHT